MAASLLFSLAALGGTGRATTPTSARPQALQARIGGFLGPSFQVTLEGDTLQYEARRPGGRLESAATLRPTESQWRAFRAALNAQGVKRWRPRYIDAGVADGTQWSLNITYPDLKVQVSGSNQYPNHTGQPGPGAQPTRAFQAYLNAVEALVGGRTFR